MRSMNMTRIGHDDKQEHLVIFKILELTFSTNKLFLFKFFLLRTSSWFPLVTPESIKSKLLPQRPGEDPLAVQKTPF